MTTLLTRLFISHHILNKTGNLLSSHYIQTSFSELLPLLMWLLTRRQSPWQQLSLPPLMPFLVTTALLFVLCVLALRLNTERSLLLLLPRRKFPKLLRYPRWCCITLLKKPSYQWGPIRFNCKYKYNLGKSPTFVNLIFHCLNSIRNYKKRSTCAMVETLRVKRTDPLFLLALKLSLRDTWLHSSRFLARLYQPSMLWSLISCSQGVKMTHNKAKFYSAFRSMNFPDTFLFPTWASSDIKLTSYLKAQELIYLALNNKHDYIKEGFRYHWSMKSSNRIIYENKLMSRKNP